MNKLLTATALALVTGAALAQDQGMVNVTESDQYGAYLTAGDRPVYMFTADTQGQDGSDAMISCTGECLGAWPPVTVSGEPEAGEGAMSDMVGTTEHDGQMVMTYNGWPLYHFARDAAGQPPQGQEVESFGGEWYLIGPDGMRIEGEAG